MRPPPRVALLAGLLPLLAALTAPASRAERLDFPTRILPVLTKAGCNSGACHGAATGQGGFRLSLLGCEPELDHAWLTRELGGRRIDLDQPAESLFLRKATRRIDHEGDRRFHRDSPEAALLERWVAAGTPYGPPNLRVVALTAIPAELLALPVLPPTPIRVLAELSDGTREDVTGVALHGSNDDAVADVDRRGLVTARGPGTTGIMIRYGGQVAVTRVDVPFPDIVPESAFASFHPRNAVDHLVLARWRRLQLPPSPTTDDAMFLRRVTLDLAGRLPTPQEITAFLDAPPSPEKRSRAIDRLIGSEDFTDLWTMHLADLLLISGRRGSENGAQAWQGWLREQVARNRPWDEVVRELITANGRIADVGPANFAVLANDPRDLAEHVGTMFLGARIGCARCHTHPSDRWTQEDYHRFAAFLARIDREDGQVREIDRGEVVHPRTGRVMTPKPLGTATESSLEHGSRRARLAAWLTAKDNHPFARAFVNRVWKHLLGRGLVEPVDDLRPTNPASHPEVLEALATRFIEHGFDLRDLVRTIADSSTYQLSSEALPANAADQRLLSHALPKTPPAQVRLDMIAQATGVAEVFAVQPEARRAVQLIGTQTPSYALDVLGRCSRERTCAPSTTVGVGLAAALHLLHGSTIQRRLESGIVRELASSSPANDAEAVRLLYLRTLARPPRPAELEFWSAQLAAARTAVEARSDASTSGSASSTSRRQALEDLLWALLNSREFHLVY